MITKEISKEEAYIIDILREAKPYEQIIINKDKAGKVNSYLIVKSQKIMVSELSINEVKY